MAYLEKRSWLEQAKLLPLGARRRVDHDCGGGRTLIVSHDERGFAAHCFRCNESGFEKHGLRPINQLQMRRAENEVFNRPTELPNDFTDDVPPWAATWLYKAGVFKETAREYGIGWSPALQRVILPVYDDAGKLVFMQARAVSKNQKPKYLNRCAVNKENVLFTARAPCADWSRQADESRVIVTEDILSAIRVGVVCTAVSTLGTSVSDGQANILAKFKHCTFWYDGDEAGLTGSRKGMQKLRMFCDKTDRIVTPKDPKLYPNREIRSLLDDK